MAAWLSPRPAIGASELGRRLAAQAERARPDLTHIVELIFRRVRMVAGDALPKIAARLVERLPQDPGAALDIGAEIVAQREKGRLARRAPMRGNLREPAVVDLHRADVDGL